MAITVESPRGTDALTEFVLFQDAVYADRSARWPALPPLQVPLLAGASPFTEGRTIHPLLARDGDRILARAVAVLDGRYNRHWNERLGHLLMFEARPGTRQATRLLADAACEWLRERGAEAARAGFGMLEFPFVIDDYTSLPPSILRHNPAYYHVLLKDAGFESEHGMVDYRIEVRPELVARWESALEAVRRAGYDIVPLADVPEARRAAEFTELWNDGFKAHWGYTPFSEAEIALLLSAFAPTGVLETSVVAYRAGRPVGPRHGRSAHGPRRRSIRAGGLAAAGSLRDPGRGAPDLRRAGGSRSGSRSRARLPLDEPRLRGRVAVPDRPLSGHDVRPAGLWVLRQARRRRVLLAARSGPTRRGDRT